MTMLDSETLWGVVFHIPILPKIHCNVGNSGKTIT
jgi:hypothetical protein